MREHLLRAYHRRRFLKAYRIFRNSAERHKAAGHKVEFHAVNQASMSVRCEQCPDLEV